MRDSSTEKLYLLSFDIDGTVAGPNYAVYGIGGVYEMLLRDLQQLPQVEVILNSGKPAHILEQSARRFGGQYVVACNGAVCHMIGGESLIYGSGSDDLAHLSRHLGIPEGASGILPIHINGRSHQVAIEDGTHNAVLTIFSDPESVKHRWEFEGGIDRMQLYEYLTAHIASHSLNLYVLNPHGDGAVDIVRVHEGKPIDKSTLPHMVRKLWPNRDNINIAMFGDGSNDVPAMIVEGVTGVTFAEADEEKVKKPVLANAGVVTSRPAWIKHQDGAYVAGGGVVEGVRLLAKQGFFDDLTTEIIKICDKHLAHFS